MQSYLACIEGVTKRYGATTALSNVSLMIPTGVVGLIGPNGSGKTTLLEMILGRRSPDEGRVITFGQDPVKHSSVIKQDISMVFQSVPLPAYATVGELITLYSVCHNVNGIAQDLVSSIGLVDSLGKQVQKLSGGQKQRLALILSLIGNPDLLILDEPTSSLDPQARRVAWRLIREHVEQPGKTVIMSSQSMEEAQVVCDRIAVIDGGVIQAFDTSKALIDKFAPGYSVQFTTSHKHRTVLEGLEFTNLELLEEDDCLTVKIKVDDVRSTHAVIKTIEALLGTNIVNLFIQPSTLDDVFLNITGHQIRE